MIFTHFTLDFVIQTQTSPVTYTQIPTGMIPKLQPINDNFDLSWINKETQCWIHYPNQQVGPIYVKGIVKGIVPLSFNKGNSKVMCLLENGTTHETKASCLERRRHSNSLEKDLIDLETINAAEVLVQLRRRFEEKKIHTYMWNSLIIVNPFTRIEGMYDQKTMRNYTQKVIHMKKSLPQLQPHIYGFICNILNNMRRSPKAQMVSISGQSGSGKTETNKQCLRIISYVCESHLRTSELIPSSLIEQRILNCDNVLQCFGNAKTSKNDNSSRFGKLITQKINVKLMQIWQCEIKVFFLEKSRIVHQIAGERNFHIFYLLLAYCQESMKQGLGLKTPGGLELRQSDFNYLVKDAVMLKQEDKAMWQNLNKSFTLLDITEGQKTHILQIIAAVLHLGNLQFDETNLTDHEPCEIVNEEILSLISQLLLVEQNQLKEALVFNRKELAGEVMYLPMPQKQCIENRDSIAKSLYENLFLWIVDQLNKKVNQSKKPDNPHTVMDVKTIKMLDIYGFEVFEYNSFEQLCVNYTNERIHQIYLDEIFKNEKNILRKEGLEGAVPNLKFTDNSKIIELLDTSYKSIYNLLDESCSLNVKDEDFLASVKKICEGHDNFPSANSVTFKKCFIVRHTPGDIEYMVSGFRNKNKDFLREDVMEKFAKSKSVILSEKYKQLFEVSKSEVNKKFLGFKIRKEVTALINQMSNNSDIHFIRCIKPNQFKQALTFVERVCFNQIKYLGILDTVRMRRDCYHVRMPYQQFYKKFGILNGSTKEMIEIEAGSTSEQQCKEKTKHLMQKLKSDKAHSSHLEYLFGNQRIFMKMDTNNYLNKVLKQKTKTIAYALTIIKATFRNKHKKNQRLNFSVHIVKVQRVIKSYLKDIIEIKFKKAVRVIERQWIARSQCYFIRKKRIPIMVMQKYIKKLLSKKKFESKNNAFRFAHNLLGSAIKTHPLANKLGNHIQIRQQFLGFVYDQVWCGFGQLYTARIKKYLKSYHQSIRNRHRIVNASDKTAARLLIKNTGIICKYFKAITWSHRCERVHDDVVKIQKYLKMVGSRGKYLGLKRYAIRIQRAWRRFKADRHFNMEYTRKYYEELQEMESEMRARLYRSVKANVLVTHEGYEKVLQKFQRLKKDKIILFYYLLDIQVFSHSPALTNWTQNYLAVSEQCIMKQNPIQYVDVSATHTIASSTSKIYTWGAVPTLEIESTALRRGTNVEEVPISTGKIVKVVAEENVTRVDTINPVSQQIVSHLGSKQQAETLSKQKQDNTNKQWYTLSSNFVLLNGIVLTMQSVSFSKLSIPEKVNQLSCGMSHVICKTILKKVYTWGDNKHGQLGTGDYYSTNGLQARLVEYFYRRRVPVVQVAASPDGSLVIDSNSKVYWFGSNGTIRGVATPEQVLLSSKSYFLSNHTKYSPIRIVSRWSKDISLIGLTIACHDGLLKGQISLRKKVLQNLMSKWNDDISTINPPYSQSVADHISQRHMPLPTSQNGSLTPRNMTNKQIKDKIISDIQKIEQAEKELLRTRRNHRGWRNQL